MRRHARKRTPLPKARRRKSTIRRSTDVDIREIHAWLVKQSKRDVLGTFLCNWRLTEESHKEGELLVYVEGETRTAVAYQWGGLIRPGILEVRDDMRGKGIGSKLVARRVAQAYKRNECLLFIECKPSSSIPFWQRMGFTLLKSEGGKNYAYRVLEKKHTLPSNGNPIRVAISFFPDQREWNEDVPALVITTPPAVKTSDGVVHLGERVFFFGTLYPDIRDPVVEIDVEGQMIYRDKAKYKEAERIGVRRCANGFYIDQIHLPSATTKKGSE